MTPQEVKLWVRLRELRPLGLHFRRQSPLLHYIVDFECRRARLVIEVDGGQHTFEKHSARDTERDARLHAAGYGVLRFWNHEIDVNPEGVLETIVNAARLRTPPGSRLRRSPPSPEGEG